MTKPEFPMRNALLYIPFVLSCLNINNKKSIILKVSVLNGRLEVSQLLISHVSVAFLSTSKNALIISERSDVVLLFFSGDICSFGP